MKKPSWLHRVRIGSRGQLRFDSLTDEGEQLPLSEVGAEVVASAPQRPTPTVAPTTRPPSVLGYGIDFGTSNSQIAVARKESVDVVALERTALPQNLPSTVYLHRNANRVAGTDAVQQYLFTAMDRTNCKSCDLVEWVRGEAHTGCRQCRPGGACADSRLIAGVKSDLSDPSFDSTHSWAVDFTPEALVAVVLRRLKQTADREVGEDVRRVVMGHPVLFAGAEGPRAAEFQTLARTRLEEAARLAGFEEVRFLPEPSAALTGDRFQSGTILAADFGGGTFDAAVIEAPQLPGEVSGLAGVAIGGERFDALVFDNKVAPELGLTQRYRDERGHELALPARFQVRLRNLRGLRQVLTDPDFGPTIRRFRSYTGGEKLGVLEEIIYGGFAADLYKAIEQAKVDLSHAPDTSIRLQKGRVVDLDIPLSRQEFDDIIADDLARIRATIDAALDHAGRRPDEISLVIRTGGSSLIPAFQSLLFDMFGEDKVQERGPFDAVALGLGTYAQEVFA